MGNGGTPKTGNASEVCIGDAASPLILLAVPPCSVSPLPDKDFIVRPTICLLFHQSTGRDSENPPSCVAGLSQTRPSGTWQFHLLLRATIYFRHIGLGNMAHLTQFLRHRLNMTASIFTLPSNQLRISREWHSTCLSTRFLVILQPKNISLMLKLPIFDTLCPIKCQRWESY